MLSIKTMIKVFNEGYLDLFSFMETYPFKNIQQIDELIENDIVLIYFEDNIISESSDCSIFSMLTNNNVSVSLKKEIIQKYFEHFNKIIEINYLKEQNYILNHAAFSYHNEYTYKRYHNNQYLNPDDSKLLPSKENFFKEYIKDEVFCGIELDDSFKLWLEMQ